jgi:glutathione peroxidase-family protein
MKTIVLATIAGAFALGTLHAQEIGKAAPSFAAKDLKGESVSLSDLRGKTVVLEWVNFSCPFVKKHYSSGNMPKLQADYGAKGVVWITVNSSAKGNQGHAEAAEMTAMVEKEGGKAAHFVMDTDGTIGKAYDAKVTPHMFIIDKEGILVYDGAIDSKSSTDPADVATADKLFANALEAVLSGKEVSNAKNKPYGCGVKY